MNKKYFLSTILLLTTAFSYVNSAYFTIENKSNKFIRVCPIWNGRSEVYVNLRPGASESFNSYFHNVTAIRWQEKVDLQLPKEIFAFKFFEQSISLGRFNLGGSFHILNDGSYDSHFGIDGSQEGIATNIIFE